MLIHDSVNDNSFLAFLCKGNRKPRSHTSELSLVLILPDGFRACLSGFYPGVLSRGYYCDSQYGHAFIHGLDGGGGGVLLKR